MRADRFDAEPGRRDKLPDPLYIGFVDSLLVDIRGLILSAIATVAAAVVAAIAARSVGLWICAILMILTCVVRWRIMKRHAESRPSPNIQVARRREFAFLAGAVSFMGLMAIWTFVAFCVTEDPFPRFLTATITISYAFGMWTRSFAIDRGTNAQIIVAFVPLSAAMVVAGGWYPAMIFVAFIPLFLFIKSSSSRFKENYLAEVAAKNQVATLAARLDTALNNMAQGLCMVDAAGRLTLTNKQFLRIFRLGEENAPVGTDLRSILRRLVRQGVIGRAEAGKLVTRLFRERKGELAVPLDTRDERALEISVQRLGDGGSVLVVQDVTERRAAEAAIYRMAWYDPVTGLPNRRRFEKALAKALLAARDDPRNAAILLFDLDGFKEVNDSLGHARGDKLLSRVGERMRGALGDLDVVARWGGDEFAVLLAPRPQAQEATLLTERIIAEMSRPFPIDGYEIQIGASAGIAPIDRDVANLETLVANADLALYAAKAEGRNRFRVFEPQFGIHAERRRTLEVDLKAAIANETIEVHYQPINCVETRKIIGCEALVRWTHPSRGRISPVEFIPIAEDLGLMDALGRSILRRACRDCASWPEPNFVAVNLSPLQVRGGRALAAISEALESSGLPPHRLEVEITESTILHDLPSTRQMLRSIRELGVRIALDDFGTGYSSLSYLHTFPLDKIKIDRSFTMAIGADQRASIVIASVAGMCKMLGMNVLIEGVETEDQMQFVENLGSVAEVQGFLFSPAIPEFQIRAMFEQAAARRIA
jgi:diguanylate cyclase (GGDEF)-like protein